MNDSDAVARPPVERAHLRSADLRVREQLPQTLRVLGCDDHRPKTTAARRIRQTLDGPVVARRGVERQRDRLPARLGAMVAAQFQPARHVGYGLRDGVPVRQRRRKAHRQIAALLFRKAQLLGAPLHVPRGLLDLERLVDHYDRVLRQVIQQRMPQQEARVQRRVVERDAGYQIRQLVLHAVTLGRIRIAEIEAAHQFVDVRLVGQCGEHFSGRQHGNSVQMLPGALGVGIEQADRIDLVPPQIEAHRMVVPRPVDIHNSPAPRRRTRMIHQRPHAVADLRPMLKRRLHRHRLAPGDRAGALPQPVGRDRLLQQTRNGGNDQRRRAGRPAQRAQCPHALLNRARLNGQTLVRQHFRLCEVQQRRLVVAVRLQLLDQPARVVRMRTDDQQRTLEVSPQAGDHHRLGCFRRSSG